MKNKALLLLISLLLPAHACQREHCRRYCPEGTEIAGRGRVENGELWCEKKGADGKAVKEGPYTAWHSSTQKKMAGEWRGGLRDGKWTAWYANGRLQDEGNWKEGEADGEWSWWHQNGRLIQQGTFKNGIQVGKWTFWYPSGRPSRKGTFNNGIRDGAWTSWYPNGNPREESSYSNGVKDGLWRRYHNNGKTAEKGEYKSDTRKGRWIFGNAAGLVVRTETYDYPDDLKNSLESAAVSTEPRPEGESLLLIVVDALRADGLNPYGYDKPTSPAVAKLATEGIVYENVHAASPWTAPSFATIMTGVSPTVHRVGRRLYRDSPNVSKDETMTVGRVRITCLSDSIPNIAQMLAPGRLKRGAIVNNAFLHPATGLAADFDYYDLIIPNEKNEKQYMASEGRMRKATEVTDTALAWIELQEKKPFFLMLHYFDPHVAYSAPQKYREQFATFNTQRYQQGFSDVVPVRLGELKPTPEEQLQIRGHYDGEVRYTDDEIGRLLRRMEERDLLADTWVVFTADHGEELFDHGFTDHGHRYEEEVTRVPLIIRAPGGKWNAGVRVASSARHIDIAPTVLDIFGIDGPKNLEGTSVLSLIEDETAPPRPAYMEYNLYWGSQYSWYDGTRFKLIEPLEANEMEIKVKEGFVYDLKKDPEERNRLDKNHEMYKKLKKTAEAHRARLAVGASKHKEAPNVVLSKEVEESLKQLGYLND